MLHSFIVFIIALFIHNACLQKFLGSVVLAHTQDWGSPLETFFSLYSFLQLSFSIHTGYLFPFSVCLFSYIFQSLFIFLFFFCIILLIIKVVLIIGAFYRAHFKCKCEKIISVNRRQDVIVNASSLFHAQILFSWWLLNMRSLVLHSRIVLSSISGTTFRCAPRFRLPS